MLPPPGLDPWTVQYIASCYAGYVIRIVKWHAITYLEEYLTFVKSLSLGYVAFSFLQGIKPVENM
jgi:hypothetical protein